MTFKSIFASILAIGIPTLAVFAATAPAFQGPKSLPVTENVPGVIWNGVATTGTIILKNDPVDSSGNTGNVVLDSGKNIQTSFQGLSNLNFRNWLLNSSQPFQLNVNGELVVGQVGLGVAAGSTGKVQAAKFCFSPTDCISSWSGLGTGNYISKSGDTLTSGGLSYATTSHAAVSGFTSTANQAFTAFPAYFGEGTGFLADGNPRIGLSVTGAKVYGVQAVGTGSGSTGGSFTGDTGIYANGTFTGVNSSAPIAGTFSNPSASTAELASGFTAGDFSSSLVDGRGVNATGFQGGYFKGANIGVTGEGGAAGGIFTGTTYGLQATTASGIAGSFQTANGTGLEVQAPKGLTISSTSLGANITTTAPSSIAVQAKATGLNSYGGSFSASPGVTGGTSVALIAIQTDNILNTTQLAAQTSPTQQWGVKAGKDIYTATDISASGNVWGGALTPAFSATGWTAMTTAAPMTANGPRCGSKPVTTVANTTYACPDGMFMAGFVTGATAGQVSKLICCPL